MPFEFRKVYLDLITDQGQVCVLYLSWVRFFQRWHAQASVEIYEPGGKRTIVHALSAPQPVDPERGLDQLPVALTIPGGTLELEVKPVHEAWTPAVASPVPELNWSVGALRTSTCITLTTDQGVRKFRGEGYIDFVTLTRPTRKLGLRSLRWGRAHMFERSLCFTALELQDGRHWFVGVTQMHGRPARSYGNLSVKLEDGCGQVRFGTGGQVLRFDKPTVLHAGSAFDAERIPSPLHRQVCLLVGGPHEERRWLCQARVDGSHGTGHALHEVVWFGKHARLAVKGKLKG